MERAIGRLSIRLMVLVLLSVGTPRVLKADCSGMSDIVYPEDGIYQMTCEDDGADESACLLDSLDSCEALCPHGAEEYGSCYFDTVRFSPGEYTDNCQCGGDYQALMAGGILYPNDSITSENGAYTLIYQDDGNLVLYENSGPTPIWASGTVDDNPGVAQMQYDGNFVVYDGDNTPVWASDTSGYDGYPITTVVLDDGNLVVYDSIDDPPPVLWSAF
jgi:hypothetical protein